MNQDFNIQLLVSFLSGNTSKEESVSVEEWINSSGENKMMFEEFRKVWELSASKLEPMPIDVDQAWEKFKSLADFKEDRKPQIEIQAPEESKFQINRFVKVFAQIAAVIVKGICSDCCCYCCSVWPLFCSWDKKQNRKTQCYCICRPEVFTCFAS